MKKYLTLLCLIGLAALSYGFLGLGNPGIIGVLFFVDGNGAAGVTVDFSGDANAQSITDLDGIYEYNGLVDDLMPGNTVIVTPTSDPIVDHDCLDIHDYWLTLNHIFGQAPLQNPLAILAADIDNSETVTTQDLFALDQFLLGYNDNWNNNTELRFIHEDYLFPNPQNPFVEPRPESATVTSFLPAADVGFVSYRVGDASECLETPTPGNVSFNIISPAIAPQGGNLSVGVSVEDYTNINGFQYTITWDPTLLALQSITPTGALPNLDQSNFGPGAMATGMLRVVYTENSIGGTGASLPDGTTLFELNFIATGAVGSTATVNINDNPLKLLALDAAGEPIIPQVGTGSITVNQAVTLDVSSATVNAGDNFCLDITVLDFLDILGFQFSVNYDPTILQYTGATGFGLPGYDASDINNPGPGQITSTWIDASSTGVSLADGAVLVQLCFTALQNGQTPVAITGVPTLIEFVNGDNELLALVSNPGTVTVGNSTPLVCPPDTVVTNTPGTCEAFVPITSPALPSPGSLTNSYNGGPDASDTYPVGTTDVIFTFISDLGDTLTCNTLITVVDTEPPTVACQDTTVYLDASGTVILTPDLLIPPGELSFTNSGQNLDVSNERGVVMGDLDGDGDLDLFFTADDGPNHVWFNDGAGYFTDSGQALGNGSSFGVALADLDADGDLDAAVCNLSGQANRIWLNDGTGTFTDSGQTLGSGNTTSVAIADIDNDGDQDLFFGNYNGQPARVYLNDGTASFPGGGIAVGSENTHDVVLGDVNNDDNVDAMTVNRSNAGNRIYYGDGTGNFTNSGQLLGSFESTNGVLADFDGDGDLDAAICHLGDNNQVWINDGGGNFTDSGQAVGNQQYFGIYAADVEQDGDLDIFLARRGFSGGPNQVWINDGNANFSYTGLDAGGAMTRSLAIGDVDSDGDVDVVAQNSESPNQVYFNTSTFGASDNCTATEDLIIDINPNPLDCSMVGQAQTVTVIVTDEAGLSDTCTSLVTVLDTIAPVVISCPPTFTVTADPGAGGAIANWTEPEFTDNCPLTVDCNFQSGDFLPCGTTEVICTATDESGNTANCNFTVEVECSPSSCNINWNISQVDSLGHGCCWELGYDYTGSSILHAIGFTTLNGEHIDHTVAPGYFTPNDLNHDIVIVPDNFSPMPNSLNGLAELCFSNVFASPVEVAVTYYDSTYAIACTDTLSFACEPEPPCLAVLADTIGCDTAGYFYQIDIQVPPSTDFPVGLVKLNVTSPASLAGAYPVTFGTPILPGDQATLNFSFPAPPFFSDPDSLCYVLTAHNGPGEEICCFVLEDCVPFPDCDPCPEVGAIAVVNDTCCYQMQITNNYSVVNYFTEIQTTILTPGVVFSAVDYPLGSGWSQASPQLLNSITWLHNSGGIPNNLTDFGLFDFCVSGVTTTDSVCVAVDWINEVGIVCQDTVKVFCPECILITEEEISCDSTTGVYSYQFFGENWSDGYTVNAVSVLNDDPRFAVAPSTINFLDTPPGGGFGPLSFDITPISGVPGDTLCVDLVLRQVINDSINIECCYLTHCIVIPPCTNDSNDGDCQELTCVPPPDVSIGCGELPLGFDRSDEAQLTALFGTPTAGDLCNDYSWAQTGIILEDNGCEGGGITRIFTTYDPSGNPSTNTCEQVITITEQETSYQIRFPADVTADCETFPFIGAEQIEALVSGCSDVAINFSDEQLEPQSPEECFRIARTYTVLDWCQWDGASAALVIDRDEDCDGIPGDEEVYIIHNPSGAFIDQDADPTNNVPAAGLRGTSCDGQTNPAGHWRNDSTHPGLNTVGIWEYTQIITVTQTEFFVFPITDIDTPFCTDDPANCTGNVSMDLQVEHCPFLPYSIFLAYDEGSDGNSEATLELFDDGSFNVISGPGLINPSLNGTIWTIDIPTAAIGDHSIFLQPASVCGFGPEIFLNFSVVECDFSIGCLDGIIATLLPIDPPTDVDGDGDLDDAGIEVTPDMFLLGDPIGCSPPAALSINFVGETPDINQSSLWLTCDQLDDAPVEIHVWDETGGSDFCVTSAQVQDPQSLCGNLFNSGSQENVLLYPNPATDELLILADHHGAARLTIVGMSSQFTSRQPIDISGQAVLQDISQLLPGFYTLRLQYADGTVLYQRFVKM